MERQGLGGSPGRERERQAPGVGRADTGRGVDSHGSQMHEIPGSVHYTRRVLESLSYSGSPCSARRTWGDEGGAVAQEVGQQARDLWGAEGGVEDGGCAQGLLRCFCHHPRPHRALS